MNSIAKEVHRCECELPGNELKCPQFMKETEIDHLLMQLGNISHQMVRRKIKQMKGSKYVREVPRVPACSIDDLDIIAITH
jgi:hypothetical protein